MEKLVTITREVCTVINNKMMLSSLTMPLTGTSREASREASCAKGHLFSRWILMIFRLMCIVTGHCRKNHRCAICSCSLVLKFFRYVRFGLVPNFPPAEKPREVIKDVPVEKIIERVVEVIKEVSIYHNHPVPFP